MGQPWKNINSKQGKLRTAFCWVVYRKTTKHNYMINMSAFQNYGRKLYMLTWIVVYWRSILSYTMSVNYNSHEYTIVYSYNSWEHAYTVCCHDFEKLTLQLIGMKKIEYLSCYLTYCYVCSLQVLMEYKI